MRSVMKLLTALCAVTCAVLAQSNPETNTRFGRVRGVWLKTNREAEIAGFLGLPYAKPPIGELRFESPQPWTERWNDTRNATSDGPSCMQVDDDGHVLGSEDCLHLNVFTPTLSASNNETQKKKLPVLFFIHGGGFIKGSSESKSFSPEYLLDYEIVLVSLNHRLNVLGFFSTGNEVAPGNYGLKDTVAALKWVRDNIESFGGDPNSVTLMGQSSGAASAHFLAYSNSGKGLFNKLITMSGSAIAPWAFHSREEIRNSSINVAELLNCQVNETDFQVNDGNGGDKIMNNVTDAKIKECMKKANASDIVELGHFVSSNHVWRQNSVSTFGPTLEAESEGAVVTVHPQRAVRDGLLRDVPWITGVVDDEGLHKTTDLLLNSQMRDELLQNFYNLTPNFLQMGNTFKNATEAIEAIIDFYFNNSLAANIESNITQLVGDATITWSSFDTLQNHVKKMKSNVYFYLFAYQGTFSNTFRYGIPYRFGVDHGDDLNYLMPYLNERYKDLQLLNTIADRTMINVMCEMWANFVKTGVPSARLTSSWEPYQKHRRFMKFGDQFSTDRLMQSNFLPERMAFWSELMSNFSVPVKEHKVGEDESKGASKGAAPSVQVVDCLVLVSLALMSYCLMI